VRLKRVAIAAVIIFCAAHLCASRASVISTPHFDLADVHRSTNAGNPQTWRSGGYLRCERYDLRKATMLDMIRLAYGFEPDEVLGGPGWLEFDRFDVAAKTLPSTSPSARDRFHWPRWYVGFRLEVALPLPRAAWRERIRVDGTHHHLLGDRQAIGTETGPRKSSRARRGHRPGQRNTGAQCARHCRGAPPRELQFEIASVRPSRPDENGALRVTPGGGLEVRAETIRNLFATAWDIHWDHVDEMILGAPKWFDTARFDVLAKPGATTNGAPPLRSSFIDDDLRLMLRALLSERFRIKTHYEERLVKAYTLVASKAGGAKARLKRADPANRANCKEAHRVENDPRDLNPRLSRLLACQNVTLAQFAGQRLALSPNDFAYNVMDARGITGTWDFTLSYTPTGDRRIAEVCSVESARAARCRFLKRSINNFG
jgi:uncharacterized protein (TIGR03435 family)